ncbi:MAG: hypothetical protein ACI8QC_000774 [Planctomycetota bacterium]|jgi:hypothetical protein
MNAPLTFPRMTRELAGLYTRLGARRLCISAGQESSGLSLFDLDRRLGHLIPDRAVPLLVDASDPLLANAAAELLWRAGQHDVRIVEPA